VTSHAAIKSDISKSGVYEKVVVVVPANVGKFVHLGSAAKPGISKWLYALPLL
jgi:hypothetical protein